MELRDCYAEFGGDYKEVLSRLQREQTVQKFVLKFLDDKSFSSLETALQNRNYEEALRFVHTLKGICRNLSFTRLYESSSRMTEAFKAGDFENAAAGMPQLSDNCDMFSFQHRRACKHAVLSCVQFCESSSLTTV